MDDIQLIELVLIGSVTGIVGGMLGVGGSLVMIPAMTEILGPSQHLYQATAMIVNFFVVVPAVIQHRRAGAIVWGTVARLVPLAAIAVVVGVSASEAGVFSGVGEARLQALFGVFLFLVSAVDIANAASAQRARAAGSETPAAGRHARVGRTGVNWTRAFGVALPTGFFSGFLGLGGGVLAVPLQRRYLGLPIRVAIANSAAMIVALSAVGASFKNYAFYRDNNGSFEPLWLAIVLIPTAIGGSLLGAKLTHQLPVRWIRLAFNVLLLVASLRLAWPALRGDVPLP